MTSTKSSLVGMRFVSVRINGLLCYIIKNTTEPTLTQRQIPPPIIFCITFFLSLSLSIQAIHTLLFVSFWYLTMGNWERKRYEWKKEVAVLRPKIVNLRPKLQLATKFRKPALLQRDLLTLLSIRVLFYTQTFFFYSVFLYYLFSFHFFFFLVESKSLYCLCW